MNKNKLSAATGQQPSISITPLPRQTNNSQVQQQMINQSQAPASTMPSKMPPAGMKPGQNISGGAGNKAQFVICEICDGYIKDLEQLRNHMQWMHKVKVSIKYIWINIKIQCTCMFLFSELDTS